MKRGYEYGQEEQIEIMILDRIGFGYTKKEAASHAGIHRTTLLRWLSRKSEFKKLFEEAWENGEKRRSLRLWLAHPFRGKRPPTSKRTRAYPKYGKPRLPR